MPRTKAFEPTQALEKAMEIFWAKGYHDTSMDEIVTHTGVSRASLYSTFGDKKTLFLHVLDHYLETIGQELIAPLLAATKGLPDIEAYFERALSYANSDLAKYGCLLCNTNIELAPHDELISMHVETGFKTLHTGFKQALTIAEQKGQLKADTNIDEVTDYLTGIACGLMVLVKSPLPNETLNHTINFTVHSLKATIQPRNT